MKIGIKKIIAFILLSQITPLLLVAYELMEKCHSVIDAYLAGLMADGVVILFGLLLWLGMWLIED